MRFLLCNTSRVCETIRNNHDLWQVLQKVKKGARDFFCSEGVLCVDLHSLFHQDEGAREREDGNVQMSYKYNVLDVDCARQDLVYFPLTKKSMKWTKKLGSSWG